MAHPLVHTEALGGLETLCGGSRAQAPELMGFCFPPLLRPESPKVFISPPSAKSGPVRALLFDISFLMLCHVAQTYGSEVRIVRGDERVGLDPVREGKDEAGSCQLSPCAAAAYQPPLVASLPLSLLSLLSLQPLHSPGHST